MSRSAAGAFAYASFVSAALSTAVWQRELQRHAVLSAGSLAAAGLEEAKAGQEHAAASDLELRSDADREESVRLRERGEALRVRANEAAAAAAEDEGRAAELHGMAVSQEDRAADSLALAAVQDGIAKRSVAAGVEQSEGALSKGMRAHIDEVGVTLCQALPGVDVLCDVLGGATAVGLEAAAAGQSAEAAADFAVAAAAKEREGAELASAAELQGQAASEQLAADAEDGEAAALAEKAASERAKADLDEARAEELAAQSAGERDEAAVAERQSAQDAASAANEERLAAQHGMLAIGYAALLGATAGLAAIYFSLRCAISFAVQLTRLNSPAGDSTFDFYARAGIWLWFAGVVFYSLVSLPITARMLGIHQQVLSKGQAQQSFDLVQQDWKRRGGVVLLISLVAVTLQLVFLHSVRYWSAIRHGSWSWIALSLRAAADAALLLAWNLFALVVWIRFSNQASTEEWGSFWYTAQWPNTWFCLFLLGICLTLMLHHWLWLFGESRLQHRAIDSRGRARQETLTPSKETAILLGADEEPCESTALLPTSDDESSIPTDCRTEMGTKPANVRVWTAHHQILLDTWLTAVLVALLAGVWTQAKVLHPFFSMARQAALQFLLEWKRAILSTAVAVLVVFGLFAVASRRRKR
jgi:hypothetical protein